MSTSNKPPFAFILDVFEKGEGEYIYRESHRTVLKVVGVLLMLLSLVSLVLILATGEPGALLSFVFFFAAGFVCLLVGIWGSDRAVANLWGSKPR